MDTEKKDRILHLEKSITVKQDVPAEPVAEAPVETPEVPATPAEETPPAAPVEQDGEEDDTEGDGASDGDKATATPDKPRRRQKRFDQLTKEKYEGIRRAEAAEQRLAALEQQFQSRQPVPQADPAQTQGRPTLEQFGYDQEAYETARDTWVILQAKQSWSQEHQQAESQRQLQERLGKFEQRIAKFEQEQPGAWDEVLSSPVQPTPLMREAVANSEMGPKLAHYLALNLDEAFAITQLQPLEQAIAMGRLEAKLQVSAPTPSATPRPPATVTQAPAVAATLSAASPVKKTEDQKSIDEMIDDMRARNR